MIESSKNTANIERTYLGVIEDALEGCFAGRDLPAGKRDIRYVFDIMGAGPHRNIRKKEDL